MRNIGELFALIVEFGVWILAALVVLLVFLSRHYWLPYLLDGRPVRQRSARVMLASGEVRAEELPDDIPASVRALWQRGDRRAALSLLYRASVFELVRRYGVRLPVSATEGGCLAAVSAQAGAAQSGLFRRIVEAWIMTLHAAVKDRIDDIEKVVIETQEAGVRIIDKTGPLDNPADRDHCIQYMAVRSDCARLSAAA